MLNLFYWLYLWQLKEYRWDRLWAFLQTLTLPELAKKWLFGARNYPRPTLKIALVALLTLGLLGSLIRSILFNWGSTAFNLITALTFSWLLIPFAVSLSAVTLNLPSNFIKQILVFLAAKKRRRFPNLIVIGVTGSYGKSSTKEFIAQVLSKKLKVLKTAENINTDIGIARQILSSLNKNIKVYVVEMGAYKEGEIRRICGMVKPKIGVLTGLNEQHLALFGSFEKIREAKFELLKSLPEDGAAFYNADDVNLTAAIQRRHLLEGATFTKVTPYSKELIRDFALADSFKTLDFLLTNAAAAVAVSQHFNFTKDEIQSSLNALTLPSRGLQIKKSKNGAVILEDTYSCNPTGFIAALNVLENYKDKTKVVISSGIIELGGKSSVIHDEIARVAKSKANLLIVTNSGFFNPKSGVKFQSDPLQIVRSIQAIQSLPQNLVILLEGRLRTDLIRMIEKI